MKRAAAVLVALIAVNFALILGQSFFGAGVSCPEMRYWVNSFILLLVLLPALLLRFRVGRAVLLLAVALQAVADAVYVVKAHLPGSRRNAYVAAADWAIDLVRNDYKGPTADESGFFLGEYHLSNRPVIDAHSTRIAYELGGRQSSFGVCGAVDVPDYIVDEPYKVNKQWFEFAQYEILAKQSFGTREFVLYKRVK